ncbi:TetR/AcrR family transcriptional regulator [Massilia sp. METH4]|uniref:TetR/AcrR family transcriptional regulator n=1 Tax=Massilia sp. METH4 TaxID=3123041 RepID=UPI0030D28B3A
MASRIPEQIARGNLRRKQVLDAAAMCMARSGFHGASMASIARAAGMSPGHIYHYFDGKDAIIAALVSERVSRLAAQIGAIELSVDPLAEILQAVPKWIDESIDAEKARLPVEIAAEACRNSVVADIARDAEHRAQTVFISGLRAGRERLGLAIDEGVLRARTSAIFSLFEGLRMRALHEQGANTAVLAESVRIAVRGLLYE